MRGIMTLVVPLVLAFGAAQAAEFPVVLHSDLPFAPGPGITWWPQVFETDSGFGIGSEFAAGDWRAVPSGCDPAKNEDCARWMRLKITSAFHRYFMIGEAGRREDLRGAGDGGVIVEVSPELPDVYAFQIGFMGGSRYILFSAKVSRSLIKEMMLLDPRCLDVPGAQFRRSLHEDIYQTGYCAVNSMPALVAIARDALTRPPRAAMDWIGDEPLPPTTPSPAP